MRSKWKVQRPKPQRPGIIFQIPSMGWRGGQWWYRECPPFPQLRTVTTRVKRCLPGELIRVPTPRALTGASHKGSLCLARTSITDSQKERGHSA